MTSFNVTVFWPLSVRQVLDVLVGREGDTTLALPSVFRDRLSAQKTEGMSYICAQEDEEGDTPAFDASKVIVLSSQCSVSAHSEEEAIALCQKADCQAIGEVVRLFVQGNLAFVSERVGVSNPAFFERFVDPAMSGFFCKPHGTPAETLAFYNKQSRSIAGAFTFTDNEQELYVGRNRSLPDGIKCLTWDIDEDTNGISHCGVVKGLRYGGGKTSARFMKRIDAKRNMFEERL